MELRHVPPAEPRTLGAWLHIISSSTELSLVLVGLPELHDRLSLRRNRSLFSRIHRRFALDPLGPDDTREYLGMRLKAAGCDRPLFTNDASAMLHEGASGALRDIDRLATAALRSAAKRRRKLVERDDVTHAIDVGGLGGRE